MPARDLEPLPAEPPDVPEDARSRRLRVVGSTLRLLPFAVIVLVVVIGFTTPAEVHIGPLLAVAPALAGITPACGAPRWSPGCSPRWR
ncbi:hypothetical protein ACU686_28840 [Yinghuangia aomiensis]